MKRDDEGFEYPVEDDRCIKCKQCEHICPIRSKKNENIIDFKQYAAAAVTKDRDLWKVSTSGGAFTEICYAFGDSETIVFGAKFEKLDVIHDYVKGVKNIHDFRKSKYIQSEMGSCFGKVEDFVKDGRKVIFSGTPCQVAGLRSYLKNDYENLLCIDLICHGVGSPKVFSDTMKYISEKYGRSIMKYSFRNKYLCVGNLREHISTYCFDNNKKICVERDEYNKLYYSQLCLRPSCAGSCKYRTSSRWGDITIGDFKSKTTVFPSLKDYKNYSTIVINTKKGELVYRKLSKRMILLPCDLEKIKIYNPLFWRHTKDNPLRKEFFDDYTNGMSMKALINKYIPKRSSKPIRIIKDFIPYTVKQWYRSIRRQTKV